MPRVLWPVVDSSVIERLLSHLVRQGITRAVVCSNGDSDVLSQRLSDNTAFELSFTDEPVSLGTAGSIRQVAEKHSDELLLVMHGCIVSLCKFDDLIAEHRSSGSDLSVVLNPQGGDREEAAGVYLCEPSVAEHIFQNGYCDIKETLIPKLLAAKKRVQAIRLVKPVSSFRERSGYLQAMSEFLSTASDDDISLSVGKSAQGGRMWLDPSAQVGKSARICGPVVVMAGAVIDADAVVLGPTVVGRDVVIGRGSMVAESILWDGCRVGAECQVQSCMLDYGSALRSGKTAKGRTITRCKYSLSSRQKNKVSSDHTDSAMKHSRNSQQNRQNTPSVVGHAAIWRHWPRVGLARWLTLLLLCSLLWTYWPTITDLWAVWMQSDEYSSGLLVPFMALYVAWSRRGDLARCEIHPSLWGLWLFVAALALRFFGLFFMYGSAERLSLVVSVAALTLLVYGRAVFRQVWAVLVFLFLMLPLPAALELKITLPLQNWATTSAVFCLETLGYQLTRDGNIIHIGSTTVAVAEACNGLRMLSAFFVITGLVVILVKRKWWEKIVLLLSALPIGILCNTVRLTITSIAFTVVTGETWETLFHDFGGYAMMPLALAMVVLELWVLKRIVTLPTQPDLDVRGGILTTGIRH